jgi:uncharacterized protein involved in exopolysaccharide biosynthesis
MTNANDSVAGEPTEMTASTATIFDIGSLLFRRRKFMGICLAATLIPGLLILLLLPNQYESTATILPANPTSQLSSLSAMVGLSTPQLDDESSSELYPEILRSRAITDAVAHEPFLFADDGKPVRLTLADYFGEDNSDKLYDRLTEVTTIATSKITGTISVSVETEYPELSQAVLTKYLAELEHYNLVSRRSKAKEVEQYLARELAKRKLELLASQDSLKLFQEANLNWNETSNPYLLRELATLQREVAIKEQAYAYLSQEYEASKLKVQVDTPIVRVLDQPNLPLVKSSPHRLQILVVIGLLTLIFSVFCIAITENLKRRARQTERVSYDRFRRQFASVYPTLSSRILPEYGDAAPSDITVERRHRNLLVLHKQENQQ